MPKVTTCTRAVLSFSSYSYKCNRHVATGGVGQMLPSSCIIRKACIIRIRDPTVSIGPIT